MSSQNLCLDQRMKGKESFPYAVPWRDSLVRWAKVGLLSACAWGSMLPIANAGSVLPIGSVQMPPPPRISCASGLGNLAVSPTSLDFGTINVGSSSNPLTVTVSNTGCASLSVDTITMSGSVFKIQSTTCSTSLAAGGSCAINFAFAPTVAAATVTNTYTLTTSANSVSVSLKGVGKASATTTLSVAPKGSATTSNMSLSTVAQQGSASSTGGTTSSSPPPIKPTNGGVVNMPISGVTLSTTTTVSQKLDTVLANVAGQAVVSTQSAVNVANAASLPVSNDRVQVQLTVTPANISSVTQAITSAGGEVTGVGNSNTTIQAWLPVGKLNEMAGQSNVYAIRQPAKVVLFETTEAIGDATYIDTRNNNDWRDAGYTGSGVKVGVIDGGFTGYLSLLGSELPTSVTARNFVDGQTDTQVDLLNESEHGTACAEIIHDIASDAELFLAKISTNIDLEEAVNWLKTQGVKVISTSLGWYTLTPGDGTGQFENLVRDARNNGILWITAAGNDREKHWGGTYSDLIDGSHHYHNFSFPHSNVAPMVNPFGPSPGQAGYGSDYYLIPSGYSISVNVRWDDWSSVNQDYALHIVRRNTVSGNWEIVASSNNLQNGSFGQTPTEYVDHQTYGDQTGYGFAIERISSTRNVNFEVFASPFSPGKTLPERSLANLADTPSAMTVAAVDVNSPYPQETYSSEGPTNGPGGTAIGGIKKPDIAAYANVSTRSYSPFLPYKFNGTSAATPHVAGATALVWQAFPSYTPSQIQTFLETKTIDLGTSGKDTQFGIGRLYMGAFEPSIFIDVTSPYNFGSVNVGGNSTKVFTVSNTGNANLSIQQLTLTANSEFAFVSNGCSGVTLVPGGTCSFSIRFQPTTAGAKSGSLSIPSNDPDTANLTVTVTGTGVVPSLSCNSPSTGDALTPTIRSIRNGSWTDVSTWDVGNRYPNLSSDVVLVNNHVITNLPATITINTLCNHGTLSSKTDSSLEIQAKGGIYNYAEGTIKGENGVNDPTSSACNAGKDVTLKAAESVQSETKLGDLWYYTLGSPSPIVNQGKILGGVGENGSSCGGKGGNVTVLGRGVTNNSGAEIKGGQGGTASADKGGEGGRTEVFGQLGGNKDGLRDSTGFVNSQGSIVGGNGGNGATTGGRGGNLWIVAFPNVNLGPSLTNTNGCLQCSTIDRIGHNAGTGGSPNGGNGWVQIEPSVISITAGDHAEINGSDVTIFGGDDWTLNLSSANGTVIEATGNITLAVGNNSVVDLRGNSSTILKAGGEVKIFSDQVLLDPGVTLSEVIEAPKITPAPSKILGSVTLSGSGQITGQPGVTLPIRFTISNGGPEADTYQVVTSNSTGWSSETAVEVQALDSLDVELGVKLPANVGDAKVITIVATSLTDPEINATMEVRAVVTSDGAEGDANLVGSGDTTTESDNGIVTTEDNGDTSTADNGSNTGTTGNTDATTFGNNQDGIVDSYVASGVATTKVGAVITGAKVEVAKMDNSQVTQTTTTDANGQWTVTGLPAGNYTATVSAPGYNSVVQQFEVSETNSDVKVITSPPRSLLTLKMTSSPTLVRPGEKVTYTLTVANRGTGVATGVGLKLTLPTGLTLDQLNGDTCDASQLSCTLPNLDRGANATVTLVVIAGSEGGKFDLSATLTSNEYPSDVSTATLALLPYLSVTPSCTPTTDVPMLGDWQCNWTVELSPDAPEAIAKDVQVAITIPQGVTVQSATADVGTVTPQTAKVLWTLHDDLSTTGVNRATLSLAMKLTDMFLLALAQEAKVTATNYPAQTARARTAILIDDSIKVDIALVVDITGSMQGEIDGTKAALKKFIATIDASQSPTVALVVFKDVATVKAFTKDLNVLLKVIDTLKADGGGTCPEASVEALAKAARHVKEGGQIWFTTDASPYPDSDVPGVLDLLKTQNIRFNATVTGDCGDVNSLNE